MPRVGRRKDAKAANSPLRSPNSIPLNDDKNEKAARLQSRQALHEIHLNQIRAAVSPSHRKAQQGQNAASARHNKDAQPTNDGKNQSWLPDVPSLAASKRVPMLANFEEWMRMATDNKINATNSWNFALIDYFHDMSLLKEGDGVNFQRASCTLDGCVKIYTSRVDSVATETGKLLSGLASSSNKESNAAVNEGQNEDDEMGADDDDGEGGLRRKDKKKVRSSEATLALSFVQVQLKKFELEFSVDPLFKKASADFDEGGAKGLLLNHLCIDGNGRIIFDSSDDLEGSLVDTGANPIDVPENSQSDLSTNLTESSVDGAHYDIELEALRTSFLPNLQRIDEQEICPSLKGLDIGETVDMANISDLYSRKRKDSNQGPSDVDGDDLGFVGLGEDLPDLSSDPEFGNGGDVWANEAGLEPLAGVSLNHRGTLSVEGAKEDDHDIIKEENSFGVKMEFGSKGIGPKDILGYFDSAMQANWAGPEHWKIRRMRQDAVPRELPQRKDKEPFEINFQSALSRKTTEQIHTCTTTNTNISMPKSQWRSRSRYLLPDDKHFTSSQLLRLYLKPKARLGRRAIYNTNGLIGQQNSRFVANSFWAGSQPGMDPGTKDKYNADFFREDATIFPNEMLDEDVDEFADAREDFSPPFENQEQQSGLSMLGTENHGDTEAGYGSSLITKSRRLRPEYVTYAKVAKKVDVRLLKEKIWDGLGFEVHTASTKPVDASRKDDLNPIGAQEQNFTAVLNNLHYMYSAEALAEISTSYCFISLLHLANEKGLHLSNDHGLEDLSIRKDLSVLSPASA